MALDLADYFQVYDVPSYLRNQKASAIAHALNTIMNPHYVPMLRERNDASARLYLDLGERLKEDVYQPWAAQNSAAGWDAGQWVRSYWDYLRKGAETKKYVESTERDVERGHAGRNVLHYVEGVGYVTEQDLAGYRPDIYGYLERERSRAAEAPGIERYWESDVVREGTPAYWERQKNPLIAGNVYGRDQYDRYMASIWDRPNPQADAPVRYATGQGAATNRVGNIAATSAPGQVTKTPAASYLARRNMSQQYRETVAKRVGRSIAQAGVTRVPNAREDYSRAYRQNFRRF